MMKEEEEEEATVISNDDNTNIYSCSDSDNNRIGDDDDDNNNFNNNINQISKVWGTWEDLVLTCAVKRHGSLDWDSVAKEVQSRVSIDASPGNCRLKFRDLKRRFQDSGGDDGERNNETTAVEDGEIPWLEELRSLRVAELRREVQRCDDSILSLQLKVKKLEEERDENDGDNKPDLEAAAKSLPAKLNRETTESDRDNRSMNESNSTASVDKIADHDRLGGDKMVRPDPDPAYKAAVAPVKEEEGTVSKGSEMSDSGELDESGTSTGRGKRKGRRSKSGEDSSFRSGSGGDIKSSCNKSQPLIEIIEMIRSHPSGSLFESRLRSQVTKDYRRLIKQHLDIKTIEKKLEKGCYVSSSLSFYRDVKLLFTNAIVFFPPSSSESMAAQELRTLVSNEVKKQTGFVKAEDESAVSREKSSVPPLVVCKKKGSASKKTTPSSSSKQKDEKKPQDVSEEKTVTTSTTTAGARSSRRASKGIAVVAKETKTGRAKSNSKKQTDLKTESSDDEEEKEESSKTEKKTAIDKKKSMADFLKRIKKNSPEKGKETTSSKNPKKNDGNVKKENNKGKPRELRSNSTGKKKVEVENNGNKSSSKRKQPKKEAEATGKRGRESEKDSNSKQPNKRSRR